VPGKSACFAWLLFSPLSITAGGKYSLTKTFQDL